MMIRKCYISDNLKLSYLDNEGEGKPILLCLHGHFGCARYYAQLMERLEDWHVYSIDQRGHGWSDHAETGHYERSDYIGDVLTFMDTVLYNQPVFVAGHSLGGINAYQAAARRNDLVKGLIIEDVGAVEKDDASFSSKIVDFTPTLRELGDSLKIFGINDAGYFLESAEETEKGWQYRFDKANLSESQERLNGNWWDDYLASSCPALILHGKKSWVVGQEHIEEMAERRKNTEYAVFNQSGHTVNLDEPELFFPNGQAIFRQAQECVKGMDGFIACACGRMGLFAVGK